MDRNEWMVMVVEPHGRWGRHRPSRRGEEGADVKEVQDAVAEEAERHPERIFMVVKKSDFYRY